MAAGERERADSSNQRGSSVTREPENGDTDAHALRAGIHGHAPVQPAWSEGEQSQLWTTPHMASSAGLRGITPAQQHGARCVYHRRQQCVQCVSCRCGAVDSPGWCGDRNRSRVKGGGHNSTFVVWESWIAGVGFRVGVGLHRATAAERCQGANTAPQRTTSTGKGNPRTSNARVAFQRHGPDDKISCPDTLSSMVQVQTARVGCDACHRAGAERPSVSGRVDATR